MESDRVRAHTSKKVNILIDHKIENEVQQYAARSKEEITKRIKALDREWDIERWVEMNASMLAFMGVALGVFHSTGWLIIPGLVLPFLFQHAIQGWCPPVPLLRRLGVRTREEIDREKYALKVLRGDFASINHGAEQINKPLRIEKLMAAVQA